jgi:two-component system chemotaxis response regulator CheB
MRDAIVVGASAGGVQALKNLLDAVPVEIPAAILVVVHIPAYSPSALPEVLGRAGRLPVKAAEDGESLRSGQVYVAPADRHLLVAQRRLRLTRGPRENRVRPCIDTLFRSAAVDLGPRAVGVVLSGALDDGTAGLWAIKDRGGVAVVQDPAEAEYRDMPQNALAQVAVDHVLPVAEMGPKLAQLALEPTREAAAAPASMSKETAIDLGGDALRNGILELGRPSPNTCPECSGSLVEIRQGPLVRYRCHTGHAYSLQTLLAETESSIEKSLWQAVRAIEERSFLLRTLERRARNGGDEALADRYAAAAMRDEENAQRVRQLTAGRAAA